MNTKVGRPATKLKMSADELFQEIGKIGMTAVIRKYDVQYSTIKNLLNRGGYVFIPGYWKKIKKLPLFILDMGKTSEGNL